MKRFAVIMLVYLVVCVPSAWACQPQPYAQSEGLFDVLCDIATAPCGIVAACLGVEPAARQYAVKCAKPCPKSRCVMYVPERCSVVRVTYGTPCVPSRGYPAEVVYPMLDPCTPYLVIPARPHRPPTRKAEVRPPAPQTEIPERPTELKTVAPPTEQPRPRRTPDIRPAAPRPPVEKETTVPHREPIPELTEPVPQTEEQPKESPRPAPEVRREPPAPAPEERPSQQVQTPRKPEVQPIEPGREVAPPMPTRPSAPKEVPQTMSEPRQPAEPAPPATARPAKPATAPDTGTTEDKPARDVHMAPPGVDTRPVTPAARKPPQKKKPANKAYESPCSPPCGPGYMPRGCY